MIKEYSKKLSNEIGNGYSSRNLRNMRQFYLVFKDEIWQTLSAKLSWSHIIEVIWFDSINKINYYLKVCAEQNLSVRELRYKIKNKEYERLPIETKEKTITNNENKISDFIKNPILIRNSYNYTNITERILKQLILEDLDNFLIELGEGFTYIKSEYKIKLGDRYNYIDLLLYNIKYNCYVVVELKVTELKKEHIGQIKKYMNYIDKNIKNIIGIIIVKKENNFIMEYCSNERIFDTIYTLNY